MIRNRSDQRELGPDGHADLRDHGSAIPSRDSILIPRSLTDQDVREAAARGVVIFLRQSEAFEETSGSRTLQIDSSLDHARLLGVTIPEVRRITAWGERGGANAQRDKFHELLACICAREVGVVIVPDHHRLSRNLLDAERLFQAAAEHGVVLHIAGRPYNPANASDRYILEVLAGHAQYDNANQSRWRLGSKLMRAEEGSLTVPLPNGLVWVSLEDPHYWPLAAEIGLGAWVAARNAHRTKVPAMRRNRRLVDAHGNHKPLADDSGPCKVVMPFPDAALVRALSLIVRWTITDGSLPAVVGRIQRGDEQYPYPKKVPHVTGSWNYDRDAKVTWKTARASQIAEWVTSPALFGIYAAYMESLLPPSQRRLRSKQTRKGRHFACTLSRRHPPLPSALDLLPSARSAQTVSAPSGMPEAQS